MDNINEYKLESTLIKILTVDLVFANLLSVLDRFKYLPINVTSWVKIFMIIEFIISLLFVKRNGLKIKKIGALSVLFILPLFYGLTIGLFKGQMNSKMISHIYEYIMPILSLPMGYELFSAVKEENSLKKELERTMVWGGISYIACVMVFRIMYFLGFANYNAYGSGTIDYVFPYLLFMGNGTMLPFLLALAGVLSGKRSILIKVALVLLLYVLTERNNNSFQRRIKEFCLILCGVAIIVYCMKNTVLFNRIELTIDNFANEGGDVDLATGGRLSEIKMVVNLIGSNLFSWLFGGGFGTFITTESGIVRHYSHFTPLAYVMSAGIIFTIILFVCLLWYFIRSLCILSKTSRMFSGYMLMIIIGSFFGATMINEPKIWMIIGATVAFLYDFDESVIKG